MNKTLIIFFLCLLILKLCYSQDLQTILIDSSQYILVPIERIKVANVKISERECLLNELDYSNKIINNQKRLINDLQIINQNNESIIFNQDSAFSLLEKEYYSIKYRADVLAEKYDNTVIAALTGWILFAGSIILLIL